LPHRGFPVYSGGLSGTVADAVAGPTAHDTIREHTMKTVTATPTVQAAGDLVLGACPSAPAVSAG
jgi:hypothetical protein